MFLYTSFLWLLFLGEYKLFHILSKFRESVNLKKVFFVCKEVMFCRSLTNSVKIEEKVFLDSHYTLNTNDVTSILTVFDHKKIGHFQGKNFFR